MALEIEPAELGRTHAEEGKAAVVARIDQLRGGRRRRRETPEPAEGIDPLEEAQHALRDRRPANAVEAVAAGDHGAVELAHLAVGAVADERLFGRGGGGALGP